jgi:hypothetical protein
MAYLVRTVVDGYLHTMENKSGLFTYFMKLTHAGNTGQQNLIFFCHKEKYLMLIVILMLNSNTEAGLLRHSRFFCDSQFKCEKMCVFTHFTGKKYFFFGTRRKIPISNGTFNAEFQYVNSFSLPPTGFLVTAKLNVQY